MINEFLKANVAGTILTSSLVKQMNFKIQLTLH